MQIEKKFVASRKIVKCCDTRTKLFVPRASKRERDENYKVKLGRGWPGLKILSDVALSGLKALYGFWVMNKFSV